MPEAATIYDKYFSESSEGKKDYLFVRGISPAEKKVGWIRAALVEGKLHTIVQSIVAHPRSARSMSQSSGVVGMYAWWPY